jgi:anti-sigma factor RsiW
MDCIPRVAGKRCGTSQARASMLASGGQPTEVFHSLSRSSHHRDPARQAVQEWGRGSEQGFRASTFAAPRDEHVPPAGLGCRRRCVGRQWKPRPRKLWQTSCRAQVGIPMAPPGLPLGRWIMAGGPPGRGSVLPRLCGATMKRRVELQVRLTWPHRPNRDEHGQPPDASTQWRLT